MTFNTLSMGCSTIIEVSPLFKTVSELTDILALVLLPFLCHLFPIGHSPLWGLFSSRETKKGNAGQDRVNTKGGDTGLMLFLVKTRTLSRCGRARWQTPGCRVRVSITHDERGEGVKSPRKIHWSQMQLLSTPAGFLEHSPSGGSLYYKGCTLQKIISGVLGPLSRSSLPFYLTVHFHFCSSHKGVLH